MFEGAVKDILLEDELFILPRYKPRDMNNLTESTRFSKNELRKIYQGFKQECPNGICKEDSFKTLFSSFFPLGDGTLYASCVFNACKRTAKRNCINFEHFLEILSMLTRGDLMDKIHWIFYLYDVDGDGLITRDDLHTVVKGIYLMLGNQTLPQVKESTIREHVEKVFSGIYKRNEEFITEQEFAAWCSKDDRVQYFSIFDTVFTGEHES